MEVSVFNCPSCGGKTNYNKESNEWYCSYCNKTFKTLFVKEESLPVEELKERTIYYNHCSNCNKDYASLEEKESTCIHCGIKNNSYDSIIASSILTKTIEENTITIYYNEKNLKQVPKKYQYLYDKLDFQLEYVNCDLLDGVIECKYKDIYKRYIFINTIIPNLEYEDYRFMYELGNNGMTITSEDSDDISLLNKTTKHMNCISKKREDHYINIINTCINTFQKENNIVDRNDIKIENNVRIKQGFYIPIYRKDIVIDNTHYYQHIIATKDFSKNLYLQYPNIENSLNKIKRNNIISKIISPLISIPTLYILIYIVFLILEKDSFYNLLLLLSITMIILFSILKYHLKRKNEFYYDSTVISKDKYYDQIVNNSNYVKIIGGRK